MAAIIKCVGGEEKAYVQVTLPDRRDSFFTESPPVEIEPLEFIIPSQGAREVRTFTSHPYGDDGRAMWTQTISLPIARIYPTTSTKSGNTITFWWVVDAAGKTTALLPQQATAGRWMWGSPMRYEVRNLISGTDPVQGYGLKISDKAGQEKFWQSTRGPIPWEHWCGCRPDFRQCGDFPFNYCCLDCARINAGLVAADQGVEGAIARADRLLAEIERVKSLKVSN